MKGLILSGGYGARLRPLTYSQQKQLIPVANKPILFYGIEDIIEAGIEKIGIVVGPNKEQVIEVVTSKGWPAKIEFIYQDEPKGLAHALKISEAFIDNEPFVMYLGDNILRDGIVAYVEDFKKSDANAGILLAEVENPQQFGVAKLNERGEVIQLIEKPKKPPSNLALVGVYMFDPTIFEAVNNIKPSWRNELELTDAIQWLIDNGYKVRSSVVNGWWKDTGKPEDILEASRLILDEVKPDNRGRVENSTIKGRVVIGEDSIVKDGSVIKGPTIVGRNCLISNAFIGSYTSIGDNCQIINTEIEDSIVMDGTEIINARKIIDSLIGRDVKIKKSTGLPEGVRLVIGDRSEVGI